MMQWKVSGFSSNYTLFQNLWIVEAPSENAAIEKVALSFRKHYPEHVVDYARQELRAYQKSVEKPQEGKE